MKKIIFLVVVGLMSTALFAQKQTTELKSSQLPQNTQNYIKNNLPGCQISRSVKVVEKSKADYYVTVDVKGKKNLFLFDGSGAFLKRGDARDEQKMNMAIEESQKARQAEPATKGGTKAVTKPEPTEGTKTLTKPATTEGTKTVAKPATVQPASSGSVQQTGSKEVKSTGKDSTMKPVRKAATGDPDQPKK